MGLSVAENIKEIDKNIEEACTRAGRTSSGVEIIAVTKYVGPQKAYDTVEAGIQHIGENRSDGFLQKWEALGQQTTWHFIGTLQSRKVKDIIDKVDYIHSLNRLSPAKEIEKRAEGNVRCLIQVNVSGETSKHGLNPDDVIPFIRELADFGHIEIAGLMTMAPHTTDPEDARPIFRSLRMLRDRVQAENFGHAPCRHLSMGMSADYLVAVEEGATFIRIGSALVGSE